MNNNNTLNRIDYRNRIYSMQTNLIQNPGFETPDTTNPNLPANWTSFTTGTQHQFLYPVIPGRDGTGKCVGISYPTLEAGQYAGFYNEPYSITIDSTKQYEFSGYIKADNIISTGGQGAIAIIIWRDTASNRLRDNYFTNYYLDGTFNWKFFRVVTKPPVGAVTVNIEFYLNNCSGTAWYDDLSLKETTTGAATDLSGNNNSLTIYNTNAAPVSGKIGTGLRFDVINNDLADFVNTDTSSSFKSPIGTISMWVYPIGYTMATIFHLYETSGGCTNFIRCNIFPSGNMDFVAKQNDIEIVSLNLPSIYIPGNWYHIVWTQDGTGIKLYINGVDKTSLLTGTNSTAIWTNHLNQIRTSLGILGSGCRWTPYQASIILDEVSIWNEGITSSKVTTLYNNGNGIILNPASETNLKGYWRFEDVITCPQLFHNATIV